MVQTFSIFQNQPAGADGRQGVVGDVETRHGLVQAVFSKGVVALTLLRSDATRVTCRVTDVSSTLQLMPPKRRKRKKGN
jgi:hypothetical protein